MSDAPTLATTTPIPTWSILLLTILLGPGDTIAARLVAAPETAQLAVEVADLAETVADLKTEVESLQSRDSELLAALLAELQRQPSPTP